MTNSKSTTGIGPNAHITLSRLRYLIECNPNIRLPIRRCPICGFQLAYYGSGGALYFDSNCNCTSHHTPPELQGWSRLRLIIARADYPIEELLTKTELPRAREFTVEFALVGHDTTWRVTENGSIATYEIDGRTYEMVGISSTVEWAEADVRTLIARTAKVNYRIKYQRSPPRLSPAQLVEMARWSCIFYDIVSARLDNLSPQEESAMEQLGRYVKIFEHSADAEVS